MEMIEFKCEEETFEEQSEEENEDDSIDYRTEIHNVITKFIANPLELSTFATSGEIDPVTVKIPAVSVQGVGRIAYPLCPEQFASLLKISTQAPFGKGTETVVDISVRKAWEIVSSLVIINPHWLSNSLPKIVVDCCTKLGIDTVKMKVHAHLYKLLIYEEGGHFKKHKDTEKEPGMFGSLLIQLPAEHEGGALVVTHQGKEKRFDFARDSGDAAYYTSFYADCDHVLKPVTKGLRLVLAFNLVREINQSQAAAASALAPLPAGDKGFEDVLVTATKQWCNDPDNAVDKYVIPLSHKYTQTNASFAGLKGDDQKLLQFLQNVSNPATNEKLFRVYLALVTKHVSGIEEDEGGYYGGRGGHTMSTDDVSTDYQTDDWIGPQGTVDFGSLKINFHSELLHRTATADDDDDEDDDDDDDNIDEKIANIFGEDPDKEEAEGYCGNYAGTLEYWYHSAVLVFWPTEKDFDIKLSASPEQAMDTLTAMNRDSPEFRDKFTRLMSYLQRTPTVPWRLSNLLSLTLTQNIDQTKSVLNLFCKLNRTMQTEDAHIIINIMSNFGSLQPIDDELLKLFANQSLLMVTELLDLIKQQGLADETGPLSWNTLVDVLVTRIFKSSSCASLPVGDMLSVCKFLAVNCYQPLVMTRHLASQLKISTFNTIITDFVAAGEEQALFVAELQKCAVEELLNKSQQATPLTAADVDGMMDWLIQGQHSQLLDMLIPALLTYCKSQDRSHASLFQLPSVQAELKEQDHDSCPVREQLVALVLTRIDALSQHTTPPPFSWVMDLNTNTITDVRVQPFLKSNQQYIQLVGGFHGIDHARNWVNMHCGRGQLKGYIRAEAAGTGKKATVTLTKLKSYQEAVARNCAENLSEINSLCKMLRLHHSALQDVANEQHTVKRQRVETEIVDLT